MGLEVVQRAAVHRDASAGEVADHENRDLAHFTRISQPVWVLSFPCQRASCAAAFRQCHLPLEGRKLVAARSSLHVRSYFVETIMPQSDSNSTYPAAQIFLTSADFPG
jgi:hypothetical protein